MPALYKIAAEYHPFFYFWAAQFGRTTTLQRLLDANAAFNVALEWYPQLLDSALGFVEFNSDLDLSPLGMYREYIDLSETEVVGM